MRVFNAEALEATLWQSKQVVYPRRCTASQHQASCLIVPFMVVPVHCQRSSPKVSTVKPFNLAALKVDACQIILVRFILANSSDTITTQHTVPIQVAIVSIFSPISLAVLISWWNSWNKGFCSKYRHFCTLLVTGSLEESGCGWLLVCSVLYVAFIALTLLVCWRQGHLVHRTPHHSSAESLLQVTRRENTQTQIHLEDVR